MTAVRIAQHLEVAPRTVYRDIAALQAMRTPIDGQAGVGYILRPGFDLPELNFTTEEREALTVGLALIGRTGDAGLRKAAKAAGRKLAVGAPGGETGGETGATPPELFASEWNALPEPGVPLALLRRALRERRAVRLTYENAEGARTERTVLPLALTYYIDAIVLAGFCELRGDFRHFRADRMRAGALTGERFTERAEALQEAWRAQRLLEAHGAETG